MQQSGSLWNRLRILSTSLAGTLTIILLAGCESNPPTIMNPGNCNGTAASHAIAASPHVPMGTSITWNSEPPSNGPHHPVWAAYKEHAPPGVPRGNYVHNLEHGAVVLLYNCAHVQGGAGSTACTMLVQALRNVAAQVSKDPLCADPINARIVITPDATLGRAAAAVAWGQTYVADCVDEAAMLSFVNMHYSQGPESTCADGVTSF